MKRTADNLLARMEKTARQLGGLEFTDSPFLVPGAPRWHLSERWITFECGCVAERVRELRGVKEFDPVIFTDPASREYQAIYESVCEKHRARMNTRTSIGRDQNGVQYRDFKDWYTRRRALLIGRSL